MIIHDEGHSVRCLGHVGSKFLAVLVLILTDPTLAVSDHREDIQLQLAW